jgi:hypothetical protein
MTMTLTQTDTNFFEVSTESDGWVGNVWAANGHWTAQDWDGDTDDGWTTMWVAARFCVAMRQAMR